MNNSEFDRGRPFAGETDWTLPEFSARDRIALRFMGYETVFLTGEHFNELLDEDVAQRITEEYKDYAFDFANLRTAQSEVAVLRPLFLPGSEKLSNKDADKMLQNYITDLRDKKGLKDMRLRIGNLADYAAIFNWFAEQQLWVQNTPNYITTSTIDSMTGGKRCLAIMFHGIAYDADSEAPYPQYSLKTMPLYNPLYGSRIAPIIVPA